MPWFQKTCRNLGLTLHHIAKPIKESPTQTKTQTLRHDTDEQQVNKTTTLRRTTIEEIEVKNPEAN